MLALMWLLGPGDTRRGSGNNGHTVSLADHGTFTRRFQHRDARAGVDLEQPATSSQAAVQLSNRVGGLVRLKMDQQGAVPVLVAAGDHGIEVGAAILAGREPDPVARADVLGA